MTQDAAQLGLEARASQDVYGSGPQSFPYVAFFQEPWYGGGGGSSASPRQHAFRNFGFRPSDEHENVYIYGGTVYCGFQEVTVDESDGEGEYGNGNVYLNISADRFGRFSGSIGSSPSGDCSVLLYTITDKVLWDYVSGTMFIPYYN